MNAVRGKGSDPEKQCYAGLATHTKMSAGSPDRFSVSVSKIKFKSCKYKGVPEQEWTLVHFDYSCFWTGKTQT